VNGRNGTNQQLSAADQAALQAESSSVLTDLSTLGAPGTHFVHDFFLASTELTFASDQASVIAKLSGVASVAQGLTLQAQQEEGTVPQIVAQFQTGGETFNVQTEIEPLTPEEEAAVQACVAANGGNATQPGPTTTRPGGGGGGGGGGGAGGAGGGGGG